MNKNKSFQIGFIGGGLNSAIGTTHKIASQMDNHFELVAGCFSTDPNMNSETSESWRVATDRTYSNWQQLLTLENGNLDAVVVLTPTPSHVDIVIEALDLGYAVICEKALATTSSDSAKIVEAVTRNQGFLAVTYNYTGYPMLRELKHIIATEQLGDIQQIHIEMPQEGFARILKGETKPAPQNWRLHDETIPTLSLDLGVHLHQIVDFLTEKKPLKLVATTNSFGHFDGVIDNTICTIRYEENLDCQFWYGKTALGYSNGLQIRVFGCKGSAQWLQTRPEELILSNNRGNKQTLDRSSVDVNIADELRYNRFKAGHPSGFIEAFANYYLDIAIALEQYKNEGKFSTPWVSGAHTAHEGLLMLEAIEHSAKTQTWQSIRLPQ